MTTTQSIVFMPAAGTPTAALYRSLFTRALEDYKKKTRQDPTAHERVARLVRCASPEEAIDLLRKEAEQLDATHRSSLRICVFEKIAPIVEVIHPLCDTAGKATGLGSQPAEMIFGAIEILLTTPDNYVKNHKILMQLLGLMARFLKRLEILFVPEDVPYDDTTTKMIMDILVELINAFALLTQKMSPSDTVILTAKRYIRKVFAMGSGDKEIEHMLRQLDEVTSVKHFMDTALARHETVIIKRFQRERERMLWAERCRKWLSAPNSSMRASNCVRSTPP
ncbi:hypothetical protein BC834DRAFT_343378 [Gloeopeniophorella convolvens]|nr:hypothetical protein BC834DRAFT_343378 [Gloeopeniophorella convolvens]